MKKERRIRDIIIAIFVFFVSLSHHIAVGEIKEVEIGIDGLSCPFCVVGLRKQVERIETIENMDISLKEAIARVTLKEKTILNIEDYKEAVRKSGFSVREIKIMAEGEIITYGDFLALKVTGTNQIFILSDTKELKAGAKVLIKGKVHEHQEGRTYGLSIEQVENR